MATQSAAIDLPIDPRSPGYARRILKEVLRAWRVHDSHSLNVAELVVSELVTNAVVHGTGELSLRLRLADGRLRAAVADGSSVLPNARQAGPLDAGGRGLPLVAALALGWGTETTEGGGKQVWVDVAAPSQSADSSRRR